MAPSTRPRPARVPGAGVAAALLAALVAVALLAVPPAPPAPSGPDGAQVVAMDPVRSRAARWIAADAPDTAVAGTTFEVVGTATTGRHHARRVVRLVEKAGGRWRTVERARTSAYGEFTFHVDAGTVIRTRTFRVEAAPRRGMRAARTGVFLVAIVSADDTSTDPPPTDPQPTDPQPTDPQPTDPSEPPPAFDAPEALPAGYAGAGSSGSWSYLFDGGARWNPCQVIRWAYNPATEAYPALVDVQRSFARIAGVSGLMFKYTGATSYRYPGEPGGPAFPVDQADIAVSWADVTEVPQLSGSVVGLGGGRATGTTGADVRYRVTQGFLTLDNDAVLPGGFDRSGWGQVVQHEVLHALGLGHADESVQLMYGTAHAGNVRFGAGDLTGAGMIGAARGCLV